MSVNFLKNEKGVVKVTVRECKKIWKNHIGKLMIIENDWREWVENAQVEGPLLNIEKVDAAMKHVKGGRVSRQNGVAIKIMKARIKGCFLLLTWIYKEVLFEN